eukprot:TRINITY_DN2790_c0_g1_i1.p1 TRINITY_DN2790_c0_g1~~TRINITY_DN2790_c0_g1_i1.p1  ORF type:complete len:1074 (-),score=193.95 TRINITY_DN2790_c0_g1_i1:62-3166(-)
MVAGGLAAALQKKKAAQPKPASAKPKTSPKARAKKAPTNRICFEDREPVVEFPGDSVEQLNLLRRSVSETALVDVRPPPLLAALRRSGGAASGAGFGSRGSLAFAEETLAPLSPTKRFSSLSSLSTGAVSTIPEPKLCSYWLAKARGEEDCIESAVAQAMAKRAPRFNRRRSTACFSAMSDLIIPKAPEEPKPSEEDLAATAAATSTRQQASAGRRRMSLSAQRSRSKEKKVVDNSRNPSCLIDYFVSCESVDWDRVEKMVQSEKPDVNLTEDVFGWTAVHFVVHHEAGATDNPLVLAKVVDARANLEATCLRGNQVLHFAARGGNRRAVGLLLDRKADVSVGNLEGWSSLMWAAMHGHSVVCQMLLNAHAQIDATDKSGRTAPMWSARHGNAEVVCLFLEHGFHIEQADDDGLTVLDHARAFLEIRTAIYEADQLNRMLLAAAAVGDIRAVRRALRQGAFVDARDAEGKTALALAAEIKSEQCIRLLVRRGASPSFVRVNDLAAEMAEALGDAVDSSVLILTAAKDGQWLEMARAIHRGGCIYAQAEVTWLSGLMLASEHQSGAAAVGHLAELQAPLEARDPCGWTALHFAVQAGTVECVSALQFCKAEMSAETYEGETALHIAARNDNASMVQLLLAARCSMATPNVAGETALQVAAKCGCKRSLITLMNFGAKTDQKDKKGRTIYSLVIAHGHLDLATALIEPELPYPPKVVKTAETYMIDPPPEPWEDQFRAELAAVESESECSEEPSMDNDGKNDDDDNSDASSSSFNFSSASEEGKPKEVRPRYGRYTLIYTATRNLDALKLKRRMDGLLASEVMFEADGEGRSLLSLAALSPSSASGYGLAVMLLAKKAPVISADKLGNSPLMYAAKRGDELMVEKLFEFSADLNIQNAKGKTAFDFAKNTRIRGILTRVLVERKVVRGLGGSVVTPALPVNSVEAARERGVAAMVRLDALPRLDTADALAKEIRPMLAKLAPRPPTRLDVVVHPIMQVPTGSAYTDWEEEEHADAVVAKGDGRQLHGSTVRAKRLV